MKFHVERRELVVSIAAKQPEFAAQPLPARHVKSSGDYRPFQEATEASVLQCLAAQFRQCQCRDGCHGEGEGEDDE